MIGTDSAVSAAGHRARTYWFSDGLFTLGRSVFSVLFGLYFLYFPVLQSWPRWQRMAIFYLLMAINVLLNIPRSPILSWFKWRITYPRTGYVAPAAARQEFQREVKRRYPEAWVAFAFLGFCWDLPSWVGLTVLAVSLGLLWILTRGRSSFAWLFIPGLALSGVLVSLLPIAKDDRMGYLFIAFGILYFIAGTTQLTRYLRQHPAPQA